MTFRVNLDKVGSQEPEALPADQLNFQAPSEVKGIQVNFWAANIQSAEGVRF